MSSTELVALESSAGNGAEMVLLAMLPLEDQVMMVQTPARRSIGELEVFIKDEYRRVFPTKTALPANARIQKCVPMDKVVNRKHHNQQNQHHEQQKHKARHCFVELAKNVHVGNVFENMEQIYIVADTTTKSLPTYAEQGKKHKVLELPAPKQPKQPQQQPSPKSKHVESAPAAKLSAKVEEKKVAQEQAKEKKTKDKSSAVVAAPVTAPATIPTVKSSKSATSAVASTSAAATEKPKKSAKSAEPPTESVAAVASKPAAAADDSAASKRKNARARKTIDEAPAAVSADEDATATTSKSATPPPAKKAKVVALAKESAAAAEVVTKLSKTTTAKTADVVVEAVAKPVKAAKEAKKAAAVPAVKSGETSKPVESTPASDAVVRKSKKNAADESAEVPPLKRAKVDAEKPAKIKAKEKKAEAAAAAEPSAPTEKPAKLTAKVKAKEAAVAAAPAASATVEKPTKLTSKAKKEAAAAAAVATGTTADGAAAEKAAKLAAKAKKEAARAAAAAKEKEPVLKPADDTSSTDDQVPAAKKPASRPKAVATSKEEPSSGVAPPKATGNKIVRKNFMDTLAAARERVEAEKKKNSVAKPASQEPPAAAAMPTAVSTVSESADESDFEDVPPVVAKKPAPVKPATTASPKPKSKSQSVAKTAPAASTTESDASSSDEELDYSQSLLADLTGNSVVVPAAAAAPTTPTQKPRASKKVSKLALRLPTDDERTPESSQDEPVTDPSQEFFPELAQKSPTHESNSVLLSTMSKNRFSLGNIPVAKLKKSSKNPFATADSSPKTPPVQPKKRSRLPKVKA